MAALFGNLLAGDAPANLGVRNGQLAPCPDKPNCVNSRATDDEHRVAPLAFTGPAPEALARLARVVRAHSGASVVTQRADYLYATFATPLLGFVDDVEFIVNPSAKIIDARSASRLGSSDFGVNRKRIETLRAAFAVATP